MTTLNKDIADRVIAKINLHGIDNPISTRELCEELEINNEGILRITIHDLRMAGNKIGSKDSDGRYGYFIAIDKIEIQPTIDDIKARAFSLLELIKQLENWSEEEPRLF